MTRPDLAAPAADDDVARCRVCGCTEDAACEGGCWWVPDPEMGDLCSACAADIVELAPLPVECDGQGCAYSTLTPGVVLHTIDCDLAHVRRAAEQTAPKPVPTVTHCMRCGASPCMCCATEAARWSALTGLPAGRNLSKATR